MAHHQRSTVLIVLLGTLAFVLVASVQADAAGLRMSDARKAAVVKVKRLQAKLEDTGAKSSGVPGCWRKSARKVGCLGMVSGADDMVRWRCAVPMTIRKPAGASASSHRTSVTFTDTMCSF